MNDSDRLILIKQSISAVRQRMNAELDAIEAEVAQLMPAEIPRRQVPSGKSARRSYYKTWCNQL